MKSRVACFGRIAKLHGASPVLSTTWPTQGLPQATTHLESVKGGWLWYIPGGDVVTRWSRHLAGNRLIFRADRLIVSLNPPPRVYGGALVVWPGMPFPNRWYNTLIPFVLAHYGCKWKKAAWWWFLKVTSAEAHAADLFHSLSHRGANGCKLFQKFT